MSGLDLKEKHMGFKETGRIQAAGIMDANWTSFEYSKPMGRILYVCVCACMCVCVCACVRVCARDLIPFQINVPLLITSDTFSFCTTV